MAAGTDRYDAVLAELPRLSAFARFLTGDPVVAEDLVQDCVERALGSLRKRKPDTSLRAWLFTICRNRYIDLVRRHNRQPDCETLDREAGFTASEPAPGHFLHDLRQALRKLPTELQEVMWLVAVEGFTYQEAGRIIGVPTGTIRSRVFRARATLKDELAEYWTSWEDNGDA